MKEKEETSHELDFKELNIYQRRRRIQEKTKEEEEVSKEENARRIVNEEEPKKKKNSRKMQGKWNKNNPKKNLKLRRK